MDRGIPWIALMFVVYVIACLVDGTDVPAPDPSREVLEVTSEQRWRDPFVDITLALLTGNWLRAHRTSGKCVAGVVWSALLVMISVVLAFTLPGYWTPSARHLILIAGADFAARLTFTVLAARVRDYWR